MDKYIIAFDTICTGWDCNKDEEGHPVLFDTYEEALLEVFKDSYSMIDNADDETLEELGITNTQLLEMLSLMSELDMGNISRFLEDNPECNYLNEFVVKESEYIQDRKTIFILD